MKDLTQVGYTIAKKMFGFFIYIFFLEKLRRQDIGKHLNAAANFVLKQLPHYVTECCVVYVPEMGHLIVVKLQEPQVEDDELKELGFQFMVRPIFSVKKVKCLFLSFSLM